MASELQMMLAGAIREEAELRGVTQAQLAAEVGCTQKHLSRMLGGHVGGSFELWEAILKRLRIEVTWTSHWEWPSSKNTRSWRDEDAPAVVPNGGNR